MHLRNLTNHLKEENLKYTTKIMALEKNNKKLNKLLITIDGQTRPEDQKSHLFYELKKKVKELEKSLDEKSLELKRTKQNIKFTKTQELEIENQNFLDENFRLKSLLFTTATDNSTKTMDIAKEDQFLIQHKLILEFKEKMKKQHFVNEKKDEEIITLQVEKEMLEKKTGRYLDEVKSLRKTSEKMNQENKSLKDENISLSVQISHLIAAAEKFEKKNEKEKVEYEKGADFTLSERDDLKTIEKSFKNLLGQKEQVIQYQEKTIIDLRSKIEVKTKEQLYDRQVLEKELKNNKDLYEELNEKYKTLLSLRNLEEKKRVENQTKDLKNNGISSGFTRPTSRTLLPSNFKKKEEIPRDLIFKKKVKRVTAEDVHILGYELRLRMELKRIQKPDLEDLLIRNDVINDEKVSMRAMKAILEEEPFCINPEKDSLLLARFLIEDNNYEYLELDLENFNDIAVVKSIFKTLIGQYSLMEEEEEKRIKAKTQKFINKYGSSLKLFFKEYPKGAQGLNINLKQFKEVFKLKEIDVPEEVLTYMVRCLFSVSGDLNSLDKYKLFELFPIGANVEFYEFMTNDSFFKEENDK